MIGIGIVGMPNVGKSTLFNAITKTQNAEAANYPFATIEPNIGLVSVPDIRLQQLEKVINPEKTVGATVEFVDIAGLVKGASKGEGLGNQFLSHIREVDLILYVLRAFESESISHVYDRVNPVEDFEIVQSELILKDIESVEKRIGSVEKMSRIGDKEAIREYELLKKVLENLNNEIPVIDMNLTEEEREIIYELWLLTSKKRLFILNSKAGLNTEDVNRWKEILEEKTKDTVLIVDVKLINDMTSMSEEEVNEYISMLDEEPTTMKDIIIAAFKCLDLITFYTGSEKECNAWSIVNGSTVKQAAGVIHTDLEKGFVTADVVNLDKMLEVGGWVNAKDKGIVKNHGKEYIVKDGDYIIILANK